MTVDTHVQVGRWHALLLWARVNGSAHSFGLQVDDPAALVAALTCP